MPRPCVTYCRHGGICELDAGHEGPHYSRYCQWTDAESLPRAEANAKLASKGPEGRIIAMFDELLLGDDDGV